MTHNFILGLAATLSACLLGYSCSVDPSMSVDNHSFQFNIEVHQDPVSCRNILLLSLENGPQQAEEFSISYTIDNKTTDGLYTFENEEPLGTIFSRSYAEGDSEEFYLCDLPLGEHSISVEMKSKWYSSSVIKTFRVTSTPFKVHCEVDTLSSDESYLLISLTEGALSGDIFTLFWSIDEQNDNQVDGIDFSECPILRIPLGLLSPTSHQVNVRLTDNTFIVNASIGFTEPVRHPIVDLSISLDNKGDVILYISGNEYHSRIEIGSIYKIEASCSYWADGPITYNESPSEQLYFKSDTVTDETSFEASVYSDCVLSLCARQQMITALESRYQNSAVWNRYWDSSSEGGYYYKVDYHSIIHYSLDNENLKITCSAELEKNVQLRVKSNLDFCEFNSTKLNKSQEYFF